MISIILASAIIASPLASLEADFEANTVIKKELSQGERDQIWNEMHLAIIRMQSCLDDADWAADRITNINVRQTVKEAIRGAIVGLAGKTPYSVLIGACINSVSYLAAEACCAFADCVNDLNDAKYYGHVADDLQEQLWRD